MKKKCECDTRCVVMKWGNSKVIKTTKDGDN